MPEKQIYIITGGPGFGKSELAIELRNAGFLCSGEFARDLIETQLACNGETLPWKNPKRFQKEVLKQRISFFDSVPEGMLAFADRGIPDQLAFSRYKGFGTPEELVQSTKEYRYASQVFVTPPWLEIYVNDAIRTETYAEAVRIHQFITDTYLSLKYQLIELPLFSVSKRVDFILKTIHKAQSNEYEPT